MLLTADLLLHYQRCNRRGFLDLYGDRTQKNPYSDFQIKLHQERLTYHQTILQAYTVEGINFDTPEYPRKDWIAGAKATIALMQQGANYIYNGVLLADSPQSAGFPPHFSHDSEQITLISHPDLLVKHPGQSIFGDWLYVSTDIYLGKRPKQEYKISAAYHTQLLASAQGAWPETANLILRDRKNYEVDLWRSLPQMQDILESYLQALLNKEQPEVFISRQQCSLCPWLNSCYAIAKSQAHLSLIPGVTPNRYSYLKTIGITTVESLAETNPIYLQPELDPLIAEQVVRQAQSVLNNQIIFIPPNPVKLIPDLPSAQIELYFDIEAQPDLNLDYLLGVLVVDKQAKTEIFYPFMAEKPEAEELVWNQFLNLAFSYPDAPIFHFSPYEHDTVKRLAKRYKTTSATLEKLLSRFVDLHICLTGTVTLPLEGYSLKAIANWLEFKWRDSEASGSQSICWYDRWLETGDRTILDLILRYNEDDCRATYHVKNWLATQLSS